MPTRPEFKIQPEREEGRTGDTSVHTCRRQAQMNDLLSLSLAGTFDESNY